jgi:hypothetical protein
MQMVEHVAKIRETKKKKLNHKIQQKSMHERIGQVMRLRWWCRCRSCSVQRLQRLPRHEIKALQRKTLATRRKRPEKNAKSEFDPLLEELMFSDDLDDWSHELFPHLWSRIVVLEEHLVPEK